MTQGVKNKIDLGGRHTIKLQRYCNLKRIFLVNYLKYLVQKIFEDFSNLQASVKLSETVRLFLKFAILFQTCDKCIRFCEASKMF